MIILMKSTCLSVCRQGWMGVPLFLLGVVSLAFSQLGQEPQQEAMTAEELSVRFRWHQAIEASHKWVAEGAKRNFLAEGKEAIGGNLSQFRREGQLRSIVVRLQANLEAWRRLGSRSRKRSRGCLQSRVGCWKPPRFSMIWMRILPVAWTKPNLRWEVEENLEEHERLDALVKLSQNAKAMP